MKKNFEDFYSNLDLQNITNVWEDANKEKKIAKWVAIILILVVDFLIFYFIKISVSDSHVSVDIITILFFLILFIFIDSTILLLISLIFSKKRRKYSDAFKESIIGELLKNFFSNVEYIPQKGISEKIYREAKYDEYFNRYHSEDYIEGSFNNKYPMKMAEILTENVSTDSDGDTSSTIIFSGLFFKIDMDKSINSELRIKQNGVIFNKNRLKMDSQEFEKYFDVVSTNQIIGMQLLTHDIMNSLLEFRKNAKAPFDIFVNNNVIYLRFHVAKMFEASLKGNQIVDKAIVEKYFNVLNFVYSLSEKIINVIEETQI